MAAVDEFANASGGVMGGIEKAVSVTPDDDNDLEFTTRAIYVGVAGDLVVILNKETTSVTFANLAAGVFHPLRVDRVLESSTATSILACR